VSETAARDGSPFGVAYRRGLPNAELWSRLEQADAWTALPGLQAIEALRDAHEHSNREWFSALNVVYFKWYKKTGYGNDLAGQQQVQALWQKIAAGGGTPEEREVGMRLWVAFSLLSDLLQRDPSARSAGSDQGKAAQKSATQHEATQLLAQLLDRPPAIAGMVTLESVADLEKIQTDYAELRSRTGDEDGGLPDVLYGAAQTALALAKSYTILGRNDEAQNEFVESASNFERAGLSDKAAEVRATALALERKLRGQLDAAAAEKLSQLNEVEAKQSGQTALKRIESLIEMSRVETTAFDAYSALQYAESAAAELKDLGFLDPSETQPANAVDQWVEVAIHRFEQTGNALLGLVTRVGIWYHVLFAARYADLIRRDAAAAQAILAAQEKMDARLKSLNTEAAQIERARELQTRDFFPDQPAGQPSASSGKGANEASADELAARMRKIDTALVSVRERCNARMSAKEPMEDLLAELAKLTPEADEMNVPIYAAKVRLETAYVLAALEHPLEMAAAAREARERLLAGRPASLWSFSEGFERITFLDTYRREAEAAMMTRNNEQLAAVCGEVIRDFEKMRYNVREPYRAASLLIYVSEFYERAIIAAYKLQRWDDLLETIELIKARSAVRRRGEAAGAGGEADDADLMRLAADFERLSAEQGSDPTAAQKRRQIWDLLSVVRSQRSAIAPPEFSLSALQRSLRADEALVGYFWLSESVFLTICVDCGRCEVERVILTDAEGENWRELLAFIGALKSAAGRNFERAVQSVGNCFLTAKIRGFVREKERVIFSPHRGLHLFPFHAVAWTETEFIGTRFAVRYSPNFSSVMLPWIRRHEPRFFGVAVEQFADPLIPPLLQTEADLQQIEKDYAAANASTQLLLGAEAKRAEFNRWREKPEMTRARCIHFGTHGVSVLKSPNEPLEARVFLADGWLDCMDIAQLSLAAEVVVLSACESGQRSTNFREMATGHSGVPGDETFGLQSAFFQAGARCVLGSLWLVETESSSKLIRLFHEQFAKGSEAEIALRDAVRAYMADGTANRGVFYWAPYFLSCLGAAGG
jgi:hypothetical protein